MYKAEFFRTSQIFEYIKKATSIYEGLYTSAILRFNLNKFIYNMSGLF